MLFFCEVLYTGGARVAKIILAAAAKTLTPVTTEVRTFLPLALSPFFGYCIFVC